LLELKDKVLANTMSDGGGGGCLLKAKDRFGLVFKFLNLSK